MTRPTCSQLKNRLQKIKDLKAKFDLGLVKIKDTRNTAPALKLEEEMRGRIYSLDVPHFCLMAKAEHIMQADFLGPDAIETTFGFKPETQDIPPIPFSKSELERAKELGQFLVLRVDKTPDGQPLTMKNMNEMKGGKTKDGGNILYRNDYEGKLKSGPWCKDEAFFVTEVPALGWALVSKDVLPNTTDKNYLEQTEGMINYLKDSVFKGVTMPKEFQAAISEFIDSKDEIEMLMKTDWRLKTYLKLAAEKLEGLMITKLTRQAPVETIYDLVVYFQNKDKRLLENMRTWTSRRDSDDRLVHVGNFDVDVDDASVYSITPVYSASNFGVTFSRRL